MYQKPSIPKGTRDFSPSVVLKRNYIMEHIQLVFQRYGFLPIETPSMENLSTLTGKYGEEGDRLIFKILNSGDFLKKVDSTEALEAKQLIPKISDKALRYDLTVPLARYVVKHMNEIVIPFKRYQMQTVWRADRPQKGRFREFYQCDADIVGSSSLLCEIELIQLYDAVFSTLKVPTIIKLNNRKILSGIAQVLGEEDKLIAMTVALDKLDKIGLEKVKEEMLGNGISQDAIDKIDPIINLKGSITEKLTQLRAVLNDSSIGMDGISEIEEVFDKIKMLGLESSILDFDITLARGLNYYTGTIFEVQAQGVSLGSIGGGGRYDDLTGIFGLKDTMVYSVDINKVILRNTDRIKFFRGDSNNVEVLWDQLEIMPHPWLIIEDSHVNINGIVSHFEKGMVQGDYIIVEDTRSKKGSEMVIPKSLKVDQLYCDFFGRNATCSVNSIFCRTS